MDGRSSVDSHQELLKYILNESVMMSHYFCLTHEISCQNIQREGAHFIQVFHWQTTTIQSHVCNNVVVTEPSLGLARIKHVTSPAVCCCCFFLNIWQTAVSQNWVHNTMLYQDSTCRCCQCTATRSWSGNLQWWGSILHLSICTVVGIAYMFEYRLYVSRLFL